MLHQAKGPSWRSIFIIAVLNLPGLGILGAMPITGDHWNPINAGLLAIWVVANLLMISMFFYLRYDAMRSIFLIAVLNLLGLGILAVMPITGDRWNALRVGLLAIWVVFNVELFSMFIYRRYEVTSSSLSARAGFVRFDVPLDSILEVSPSRTDHGEPAIRVDHRGKDSGIEYSVFTPKDLEALVDDLRNAAPGLQPVGNDPYRLKRAPDAERRPSSGSQL